MNDFLLGVIAMSSLVATLFFIRFWKSTKDAFFLFFAGSFGIETLSRTGLAITHPSLEDFPTFYLLRLASFTLILFAILHKNKHRKN
jgi:hypothetical protein